jgi:hypothetical protein
MRIPARALTVVALLAAALPLAACGGSDETTESTAAATASRGGEGEKAGGSEHRPEAKPRARGAEKAGNAKQGVKREAEQGDDNRGPTDKTNGKTGNDGRPARNEAKRPSECPNALSAKQCAEAGQAYEKSSNSDPVPAGECPPALDAAACEQAGKAYAEAEEGSRPIQADECPRAMTAEQCRVAGEAYAEATR